MIYHMLDQQRVECYKEMERKIDLFAPIAKALEIIKDPPSQQKDTASITVKFKVPIELHTGQIQTMNMMAQYAWRIKFDCIDNVMIVQFIVADIWKT